jgi:hypothetical protein
MMMKPSGGPMFDQPMSGAITQPPDFSTPTLNIKDKKYNELN